MNNKLQTHVLGYPRVGEQRELKWALEKYWCGGISEKELDATAKELRQRHWQEQLDAGIDLLTVNDFSLYDQMLDTLCLFSAIPSRFKKAPKPITKELYFSLARGTDSQPALAMTKWFDTNYHYLVPEIEDSLKFQLCADKVLEELKEAQQLSSNIKVALIGPVTFLSLATTSAGSTSDPLDHIEDLSLAYVELIHELENHGVKWLQLDEPILSTDLSIRQEAAIAKVYQYFSEQTNIKILLASYFGSLEDNLKILESLPVAGLHLDVTCNSTEIHYLLNNWDKNKVISLGLIDGRNIWASNLKAKRECISSALQKVDRDKLWIAPSCSLLHVPYSLKNDQGLPSEVTEHLAFAHEKLAELEILAKVDTELEDRASIEQSGQRHYSKIAAEFAFNKELRNKCQQFQSDTASQRTPFPQRKVAQEQHLNLPLLPTTTIGSFPQTSEVRALRSKYRRGNLSEEQYQQGISEQIRSCIKIQEEIGLDVLVHGEFERNDMVEFFADALDGYTFSSNGWVQSYGSRCVKPPIVYGEVSRTKALSGLWTTLAQSFTEKPVKGMLSGPITMLKWSFVRDDIPLENVALQVAVALREEVDYLEKEGLKVIQVDEPALREALPLRKKQWPYFLNWATKSFRIATSGVSEQTQIHTHMCYGKFADIYDAIVALDADVISIEATRNHLDILGVFVENQYPNQIGIGIWDIHSPRVPSQGELDELLTKACSIVDLDRVWVNPDCGLKTRGWEETTTSLTRMVKAAENHREVLESNLYV